MVDLTFWLDRLLTIASNYSARINRKANVCKMVIAVYLRRSVPEYTLEMIKKNTWKRVKMQQPCI